jgi:NADH:ubiquinone oxidoreductase subunit 4 (subunit M)
MGLQRRIQTSIQTVPVHTCRAVFVLLSIGAIYWLTGTTDIFKSKDTLLSLASPDTAKWILIAFTGGFAVKMAVIPYTCGFRTLTQKHQPPCQLF